MEFYGVQSVYSESGVDLTLLRSSLDLSLQQRLRQTADAAQGAIALQQGNPRLHRYLMGAEMTVAQFESLVKVLAENHVAFVLIVGLSMIFHGSTHTTRAVDVCYGRETHNIERL